MSEDKSKLQLIGEIARANNKNLELIEEINEKEEEIERLHSIIKEVREYIELVETLAIIDKRNIFSMSALKRILEQGSDKDD